MKGRNIILFLITALFFAGCESNRWEEHERKLIDEYLKSLEDTVYVKYPSGLYYIELEPGTGIIPDANDTVLFRYKAAFTDYIQFDCNDPYAEPFRYVIGSFNGMTMKGVDEGLRYIKQGGEARLLTPSNLAYGFEGVPNVVAGYTPIIWTIELVSVLPGPGK
jgi:FKBP-type peptidyl-prolyl cis-trans isomerase